MKNGNGSHRSDLTGFTLLMLSRCDKGTLMGTVRFLLALCVVVTHDAGSSVFGFHLLSGITAVQAFYVISGFLITMVLNEREEYRRLGNFYLSGYLRLWPTYVVIAGATMATANHEVLIDALATYHWSTKLFIIGSDLTLLFQDWFLFFQLQDGHLIPALHWDGHLLAYLIVPQCWTLGVELTFYALAPFFCRSVQRLIGLFVFGIIVRMSLSVAVPSAAADPWLYRFSPAEMMIFAAGGLAFFAGKKVCSRLPAAVLSGAAWNILTLIAILILANDAAMPFWYRHFQSYWPTLYLVNSAVLIMIAVSCPVLFYGFRKSKIDSIIGELSYPMYVSHIFVTQCFMLARVPAALNPGNLLYVATTIGLSFVLFITIAVPIDLIRCKFGARVPLETKCHDATADDLHHNIAELPVLESLDRGCAEVRTPLPRHPRCAV